MFDSMFGVMYFHDPDAPEVLHHVSWNDGPWTETRCGLSIDGWPAILGTLTQEGICQKCTEPIESEDS